MGWIWYVTSLDSFRFFVGVGSSSKGSLILMLVLRLEGSVNSGVNEFCTVSFFFGETFNAIVGGISRADARAGKAEVGHFVGKYGTPKIKRGCDHTAGVKWDFAFRLGSASFADLSRGNSSSTRVCLGLVGVGCSWMAESVFCRVCNRSVISPRATSWLCLRSIFLFLLNQLWNFNTNPESKGLLGSNNYSSITLIVYCNKNLTMRIKNWNYYQIRNIFRMDIRRKNYCYMMFR